MLRIKLQDTKIFNLLFSNKKLFFEKIKISENKYHNKKFPKRNLKLIFQNLNIFKIRVEKKC